MRYLAPIALLIAILPTAAEQTASTLPAELTTEAIELEQRQTQTLLPPLTEDERLRLEALHRAQRQAQEQLHSRQLREQARSSVSPSPRASAEAPIQLNRFERERQNQQLQFDIQQQQLRFQLDSQIRR
jgi:hypothetical protein